MLFRFLRKRLAKWKCCSTCGSWQAVPPTAKLERIFVAFQTIKVVSRKSWWQPLVDNSKQERRRERETEQEWAQVFQLLFPSQNFFTQLRWFLSSCCCCCAAVAVVAAVLFFTVKRAKLHEIFIKTFSYCLFREWRSQNCCVYVIFQFACGWLMHVCA